MTKAWYDKRKHDAGFLSKVAARQRARYAKNKQNTEWVIREAEKRHRKQRDPEWAAKRKEAKRLYDESVQSDPVKRRRRNSVVNTWRNGHKATCAGIDQRKLEKRKITNPVKVILRGVKGRATRCGIEFNLEPSDIVIPTTCPVLGIPIAPFIGKFHPNTVSIDRIDSSKGYTKDNIRVISMLANRLKSNCTDPAVFRKIADYIEANLKA